MANREPDKQPAAIGKDAGIAAAGIPSGVTDWWPILDALSVDRSDAERIEARARLAGVPFQAELLASGLVEEQALFQALARELGLPFLARPAPDTLVLRDWQGLAALARSGGAKLSLMMDGSGHLIVLIAPDRLNIPALRRFIAHYPRAARRIRVVAPSALRHAIALRCGPELMRTATSELFNRFPDQSARFVVNAWQGAVLGAATVSLAFSAVLLPSPTLIGIHAVLSVAFLFCVAFRLLIGLAPPRLEAPRLGTVRPAEMPVYTVLIALYKEAEVVPDLLVALGRIVWPRAKLEIKLVCESDDVATLDALAAQELRSCIEVIRVPPGAPRTKPKALSYALPMSSGEFVALYDAEDRPHPFQLVEAWHRFRVEDETLACLQAPLSISNRHESWISALFGMEYSALFRGVLPWLARRGLVLPLGGTSNHFRRSALNAVAGWDPYNVTEDADLGVRLHRFGFRTGVISSPTLEDGPTDIRTWLPQRTRWFKGWMQTWLVHMRNPRATLAELGPRSFLTLQVLLAGMILSALSYSVFMVTAVWIAVKILLDGGVVATSFGLLAIDIFNIVCGHLGFLALVWVTLQKTERSGFWAQAGRMPLYWLLLSVAAWRCLWQLYWRPHLWEKTTHRPSRFRPGSRGRSQ